MNFGGTIRLNRVGICIIIGACLLLILYINTNSVENSKNESTQTINLKDLLISAVEVAIRGGNEVVSVRKAADIGEKSKGNTKEGINDPVTKADSNSHCVMFYNLKHSFPKIKVISEETIEENECLDTLTHHEQVNLFDISKLPDQYESVNDITVWIDPLDATKEFTENDVQYVTTMVCVALKGKPVIGVIHKPFETDPQTYWTWLDQGTSNNLKNKLHEDNNAKIKRIIVSMSHAGSVKNVSEQAFGKNNIEIITAAGAGYKALKIANGNADVYIHTTAIKKWDICAGNAIINFLGGRMTNLANEELNYSSDSNALNEKGLLATMSNHNEYLDKLKPILKPV